MTDRAAVTIPLLLLVMLLGGAALHAQPLPATEKADILLNTARQAYNDGNYAFAAERFREYLKLAYSRADAASARYGLALCLIEGAEKDYRGAVELLTVASAVKDLPERPYVLYQLGAAYRGMGDQAAALPATRPVDEARNKERADAWFRYAAINFGLAVEAFGVNPPAIDPQVNQLPTQIEWANRARCDQAEMQLRIGRAKEAQAAVETLATDKALARSRYRQLGQYYHGYAAFTLKDFNAAGRSLGQLAPFDQADFGDHAHYLLARSHHLNGERAEAQAAYDALIATYDKRRAAATAALADPSLKDKPRERAKFEAILKAAPEFLGRALYYSGALLADQGNHAEALPRFTACHELFTGTPLGAEAQLRLGMTRVELKKYPEAVATLTPLKDHAQLADEALRYLGKAQLGIAEAAKAQERADALTAAIANLTAAAEKAKGLQQSDPEARLRRAQALLDLGDALVLAKRPADAVAAYAPVTQSTVPEMAEQASYRHAVAQQLAGNYGLCDEACQRFLTNYPASTLAGEVQARFAENAMLAAAKAKAPEDARRLYAEALRRLNKLLASPPSESAARLARLGIANAHYQRGEYAEALKVIAQVPETDRTGDLLMLSYLEADCVLRTLPPEADDALSTARAIDAVERAMGLLNGYTAAVEGKPESVEALIKLGHCYQRLAALLIDPTAKRQNLALGRRVYRQALALAPEHPVLVLELGKMSARIGDPKGAFAELSKFQNAPLKDSPLAPIALIHLGDVMRLSQRSEAAVELLSKLRTDHEAAMLKDPSRAEYVPVLQYALALAYKEAGRYPDAEKLLKSLMQDFPRRHEAAEAVWRLAQIRKDAASSAVEIARRRMLAARTADEIANARKEYADAVVKMRQAGEHLSAEAAALAKKAVTPDVPAQMLYDAAWAFRTAGDWELDMKRREMIQQAIAKVQNDPELAPEVKQAKLARPVEIDPATIPLQPSEQDARKSYLAIIDMAGEMPLGFDARIELAELHMARDENDAAAKLLKEGMEAEPPAELIDRLRLRLGVCLLAQNNPKAAQEQFQAVLANTRSPWGIYARAGAGEAMFLQGDYAAAAEMLAAFVDQKGYRGVGGADRAILRLGQAYTQLRRWDEAQKALESLIQRFPSSALLHEARYGLGWVRQQLKDYDGAVTAYSEVSARVGGELGAKAHFQIGLCRMEQGRFDDAARAFLAVAYGYDYADYSAASFCEAARAYVQLKKFPEARRALERVLKEHPKGKWHDLAAQRMAELPPAEK